MSWLDPLPDAEQMRATDRWAIEEQGVPSLALMERAGAGLAAVIAQRAPAGRVAIVCGKGNNGGDGLVAARLLRQAGRDVDVLAVWDALRGDAEEQLRRLPGEPPAAFEPGRLGGAAVIVDALLGTGTSGAPREPVAGVIEAINAAEAPVVAADIPSGVDASTGEVAGAAVEAVATATFHRAKPGLWIRPGKAHAGAVHVIDIGIPPGAPLEADVGLLRDEVLAGVPHRTAGSTKFSSGNVVVIGGSTGLTGAPTMAALAAMRAGAGYVTVAAPAHLESTFSVRLLEAMFIGLPELSPERALEAVTRADAVVLGPGLGRTEEARDFARAMLARIDVPLVIDADGLNALAGVFPADLPERSAPTVLTPHAGELGRLLELESSEVERRRLFHARDAAARSGAIVVLKGDDTLVASPDGRVSVSPGGAPALATAGTGDVLSGVTGAVLAKRLPAAHAVCAAEHAVCAAVFAHLRAGVRAAEPHGPDGVIASDVIRQLPAAFAL